MTTQLHDTGEEYLMDKIDGESFTVGLFLDSSDQLADSDDLGDITTEPSGGSYARQSTTFSSTDLSGDWGITNDNTLTYDTSDSSQNVDSYFLIVNFQADDTGDGSTTDHLFTTGDLSQEYDLSGIESLDVQAGTIGGQQT